MAPRETSSTPVVVDAGIRVVDVIPEPLSGETNQDSEPNLSISPKDPNLVVLSAFTPGPFNDDARYCPSGVSPLFVSNDAGESWALSCIVPTYPSTFDITVRFGSQSGDLYAGILKNRTNILQVLRTRNPLDTRNPMQPLITRSPYDQPYIETATLAGKESIFVGENNCCSVPIAARGKTATVDVAGDMSATTPAFKQTVLEKRATLGEDLASVRVAIHPGDNAVYALFFGLTDQDAEGNLLNNVVIARDDNGGQGAPPFQALKDPNDQMPGKIVATVTMPSGQTGQQRMDLQSHGTIAVDPRTIENYPIYVAWVDTQKSKGNVLHIYESLDKGADWFERGTGFVGAISAALAVNQDGVAALLFQCLTGSGNWETHLLISADGFGSYKDYTLSRFQDSLLKSAFDPFLGDYLHLVAEGRDFVGAFSSSNEPNYDNFPFVSDFGQASLVFQRESDFVGHVLSDKSNGAQTVSPSIDPFLVRVTLKSPNPA